MKIAIIGTGNIGGNIATQLSKAGHDVTICFSRNEHALKEKATKLGEDIHTASVAEAVAQNDTLVLAVPWTEIDSVLAQAGKMDSKVVIDVTNQYGPNGLVELPTSVAEFNQGRMPGAHLARSFNMFYASYEIEVGEGQHRPAAMFFVAENEQARLISEQIIKDTGFEPIYLGGWEVAGLIDAPTGILLGKMYDPETARQIADAVRNKESALLATLVEENKTSLRLF